MKKITLCVTLRSDLKSIYGKQISGSLEKGKSIKKYAQNNMLNISKLKLMQKTCNQALRWKALDRSLMLIWWRVMIENMFMWCLFSWWSSAFTQFQYFWRLNAQLKHRKKTPSLTLRHACCLNTVFVNHISQPFTQWPLHTVSICIRYNKLSVSQFGNSWMDSELSSLGWDGKIFRLGSISFCFSVPILLPPLPSDANTDDRAMRKMMKTSIHQPPR